MNPSDEEDQHRPPSPGCVAVDGNPSRNGRRESQEGNRVIEREEHPGNRANGSQGILLDRAR